VGSLSTFKYRKSQLDSLDLFSDESIYGVISIRDWLGGNTKNLNVDVSKMEVIYEVLTADQADAASIGKGAVSLFELSVIDGQYVVTSSGNKTMQELGDAIKDILSKKNGTTSLHGIAMDDGEAYQYAITVRNGRGGVSKALNITHHEVKLIERTIRQENNVEIGLAIAKLLKTPFNELNQIDTSIGPKTLLGLGETVKRLYTEVSFLAKI
jgi:hypothetical protein